jgi:hypothetical protein
MTAVIVILTWFGIKREKDPVLAANLKSRFVRFVVFIVIGGAISVATIWLIYK